MWKKKENTLREAVHKVYNDTNEVTHIQKVNA